MDLTCTFTESIPVNEKILRIRTNKKSQKAPKIIFFCRRQIKLTDIDIG